MKTSLYLLTKKYISLLLFDTFHIILCIGLEGKHCTGFFKFVLKIKFKIKRIAVNFWVSIKKLYTYYVKVQLYLSSEPMKIFIYTIKQHELQRKFEKSFKNLKNVSYKLQNIINLFECILDHESLFFFLDFLRNSNRNVLINNYIYDNGLTFDL